MKESVLWLCQSSHVIYMTGTQNADSVLAEWHLHWKRPSLPASSLCISAPCPHTELPCLTDVGMQLCLFWNHFFHILCDQPSEKVLEMKPAPWVGSSTPGMSCELLCVDNFVAAGHALIQVSVGWSPKDLWFRSLIWNSSLKKKSDVSKAWRPAWHTVGPAAHSEVFNIMFLIF